METARSEESEMAEKSEGKEHRQGGARNGSGAEG